MKNTVRKTAHEGRVLLIAMLASMIIVATNEARAQSADFSMVFSKAKGEPQEPKGWLGPVDPVALVVGITEEFGNASLTVTAPQSAVPPVFGTTTPVASNNRTFRLVQNRRTDTRVGLRFFSIIEGGAIFPNMEQSGGDPFTSSLPQDNPYSASYQTFWGGYGVGDYAAIGQLRVKSPSVGWYVQVQTPDINLGKKFAFHPFVFVGDVDDDILFASGYHRYEQAFNPGYESFKVGTMREMPARAGLLVKYRFDGSFSIGLAGYAQTDLGGVSRTSQGRSFDLRYDRSGKVSFGGAVEAVMRF